ncbi:MAG: hypothetical protein AAF709_21350 [Pseudomonadota bacterium]
MSPGTAIATSMGFGMVIGAFCGALLVESLHDARRVDKLAFETDFHPKCKPVEIYGSTLSPRLVYLYGVWTTACDDEMRRIEAQNETTQ